MTANADNTSEVHYPNFFKWKAEEYTFQSLFFPQTESFILKPTHRKDSYMTNRKLKNVKYVALDLQSITKYF
jgi:hypothetical protein